jgi:hypothetical protein
VGKNPTRICLEFDSGENRVDFYQITQFFSCILYVNKESMYQRIFFYFGGKPGIKSFAFFINFMPVFFIYFTSYI